MELLVENVRIVQPGVRVVEGDVSIRDGVITHVGSFPRPACPAAVIDGGGNLLTPGLIDIHTHGIQQHLYESGADGLVKGTRELAQFGVTSIIPTLVPQLEPSWLEKLESVAQAIAGIGCVHIPGLHLEGPFLAIKGSAAATVPGDLGLLEELMAASLNTLLIMSVSPETPGIIPVIERLREHGVRVFITHSRASPEQTEAAISAGACHATHFYDVFYSPPETDPGVRPVGVVEAVLANKNMTVDFICDGIHVHPTAIRAALAAKGYAGITLITDSTFGAGLAPDIYDTPWGYRIRVREDDAPRHETDHYLAGSALTMNRGIANLLKWLDLPAEQVWAMATCNPARVAGLANRGTIEAGATADLVLWNHDFTPIITWSGGHPVYTKKNSS